MSDIDRHYIQLECAKPVLKDHVLHNTRPPLYWQICSSYIYSSTAFDDYIQWNIAGIPDGGFPSLSGTLPTFNPIKPSQNIETNAVRPLMSFIHSSPPHHLNTTLTNNLVPIYINPAVNTVIPSKPSPRQQTPRKLPCEAIPASTIHNPSLAPNICHSSRVYRCINRISKQNSLLPQGAMRTTW